VRQLRKKIEDDPSNPIYLLTDVYVGYRFVDAQILRGDTGLGEFESDTDADEPEEVNEPAQ